MHTTGKAADIEFIFSTLLFDSDFKPLEEDLQDIIPIINNRNIGKISFAINSRNAYIY